MNKSKQKQMLFSKISPQISRLCHLLIFQKMKKKTKIHKIFMMKNKNNLKEYKMNLIMIKIILKMEFHKQEIF